MDRVYTVFLLVLESNIVDDPDVDECYSIECDYEGCLREAIQEGKARLCTLLPDGQCGTHVGEYKGNPWYRFTSCYIRVTDCCTGDRCNSPPGYTSPTTESSTAGVTTANEMVKCGNEKYDPADTTKKCISGAGSLGHWHYLICNLSSLSFLFFHSLLTEALFLLIV